jgi:protein SCO1/2
MDDMSRVPRGVVVALVAAALVVLGAGCGDDESSSPTTTEEDSGLSGYTREPTPSVADVELPLVGGAGTIPAAAEPGTLRVVYFGYTSCPDVCPTTMSDLKRALADLPEQDADRVEVVMVTIDPDRDVDEKLGAYVTTFIADGQASRITDPAALESAAGAFGASYKVETAADGEIEVSHSADLYVVDDRGDIVLQWPFGTSYEDISADLADLLAERSAT